MGGVYTVAAEGLPDLCGWVGGWAVGRVAVGRVGGWAIGWVHAVAAEGLPVRGWVVAGWLVDCMAAEGMVGRAVACSIPLLIMGGGLR